MWDGEGQASGVTWRWLEGVVWKCLLCNVV